MTFRAPYRDVYANLLRDTRMLKAEESAIRERWFAGLDVPRKEAILFELEMLLKGIACFGNPKNHPGPTRNTPAVAHDFHDELRILRDAVDHALHLMRQLLGSRDRAYTFSRYLESVLPEDIERSKVAQDRLVQETPEDSLFALRHAFGGELEIADGLLRLGRVSHRLYFAFHGALVREIGRNAYFNPLVALEFRPEIDRIRSEQVLNALSAIETESAHRVGALAFLSLFRALRYLRIVDEYAGEPAGPRRAFVILAAFGSDVRALCRFLTQRAADVMADGFEKDILSIPATDLGDHRTRIASIATRLIALRSAFDSVAHTLSLEMRAVFERELPSPDHQLPDAELGERLLVSAARMRAALSHATRSLFVELSPDAELVELKPDARQHRLESDRLRRDVWMFARIVRAFVAKCRSAKPDVDQWQSGPSYHFVSEFQAHFRALGYALLKTSDYPRAESLLDALEDLGQRAPIGPDDLATFASECTSFYGHLESLFDTLSKRPELESLPFDKKNAAVILKLYLGGETPA